MKYGIRIEYYNKYRDGSGDIENKMKTYYANTRQQCKAFLIHFADGNKSYSREIIEQILYKQNELTDFDEFKL